MMQRYRAFTIIELIMVGIFLAAFAAIAIPRLGFSGLSDFKAETVARKIATDIRRTRQMAVADAADNNKGYEMAMLGTEPYPGYQIENADTGAIIDSHTIDSDVSCTGDTKFRFGPQGNLTVTGHNQIVVSGQGRSFTITVVFATGTVKCVEN